MNTADKIILHKRQEIRERKKTFPVTFLKDLPFYRHACLSLQASLTAPDSSGIIAEFQRYTPWRKPVERNTSVADITRGFREAGAAGISIVTDETFFGAQRGDFGEARANEIPILRKDFIIDPYQIDETKAWGADAVFLIASFLSPKEVSDLAAQAVSLGLEVLLELHEPAELGHICPNAAHIVINNRSRKDFTVNISAAVPLAALVPNDKLKIAESGIDDPETVEQFREKGFNGFILGDSLMKEADPVVAFDNFVKTIKR